MVPRFLPGGALAALAGAVMMVGVSAGPSFAFTLSSPSLAEPAVSADVENVWWDRWGRWHPNGWGWGWRPFYHPYYWRPVHRPWRRCWWTWHGRVCRWY